jgi:fatty acid desaturase
MEMTGLELENLSDSPKAPRSRFAVEWPTVLLTLTIYGGWALLCWFWAAIPYPFLFLLGGWMVAWHGSLQHEVIHGHPTRFRAINDAIGWVPLSLWLPYQIYKRSHLRHHNDEWLTDPIEDPESYYLTGAHWQRTGAFGRVLTSINNTLPGRLVIGPFIALAAFYSSEIGFILRGNFRNLGIWARHSLGVAAILYWALAICDMPVWVYLTAFAYSGLGLSRLRSFAEHHYADSKEERTAIVESTPAFGLLFLHNNLHIVHHTKPQIAWYDIPALYRKNRETFVQMNGGLVYNGYLDVARRYFFHQHHAPIHPHHQQEMIGEITSVRDNRAAQLQA